MYSSPQDCVSNDIFGHTVEVSYQQGHKVLRRSLSWCANWVTSDFFFSVSCFFTEFRWLHLCGVVFKITSHRNIIWSMLKNMAIRLMLQEHLALFQHFRLMNWYYNLLHKHTNTIINQSVKMKNHSSTSMIKSGVAFPCPFF